MEITRRGGTMAAEIAGLDPARPLTEAEQTALRAALAEHLVLLFRGQSLAPPAQIAFTEVFGAAEPHPLPTHRDATHPELLVLRNRPGAPGRRNDIWHTDITFAACPPAAAVLQALEVPDARGDTLFANLQAAYNGLSAGMRATLGPLRAVHSAVTEVRTRNRGVDNAGLAARTPAPVTHPVVRRHPETGRPALFVNPYFTKAFAGMSEAESRPLLDYLSSHATRPEYLYRHRWRAGDLLVWDNRATMHYAVHDYDETMPRLMHRTTAAGDRPV